MRLRCEWRIGIDPHGSMTDQTYCFHTSIANDFGASPVPLSAFEHRTSSQLDRFGEPAVHPYVDRLDTTRKRLHFDSLLFQALLLSSDA